MTLTFFVTASSSMQAMIRIGPRQRAALPAAVEDPPWGGDDDPWAV